MMRVRFSPPAFCFIQKSLAIAEIAKARSRFVFEAESGDRS
ncbi:hypothetical protein [Coleofasciculus sp. H7-2]